MSAERERTEAQRRWSHGDRVRVVDYSDAHGDTGTVVQNGRGKLVLVELDEENCLWPVDDDELETL